MKLAVIEPESEELFRFLGPRQERCTSVISAVEVPRAIRRARGSRGDIRRGDDVLATLGLIALSPPVIERASRLESPGLRSLDAIHLATALSVQSELAGLVTYDRRLADAATHQGITVWTPA